MWVILGDHNQVVANCDFEPDCTDLALRGERAIFHEADIPLHEIIVVEQSLKRKPEIRIFVQVEALMATVSVHCDDLAIGQIPLIIGGTKFMKPLGEFTITAEPGLRLEIDFDRTLFRGNAVEVVF